MLKTLENAKGVDGKGTLGFIYLCVGDVKFVKNQNASLLSVVGVMNLAGHEVARYAGIPFVDSLPLPHLPKRSQLISFIKRTKNLPKCLQMLLLRNAFDALRLGRSSQFVVARLLRFWDSENMKNMYYRTSYSLKETNVAVIGILTHKVTITLYAQVKSQEQKLAVPEPALIKDLDSSRKEPAILMTIVITEKDTKKFELGFSRWW
ncbi:hypothetical protein IGI04_029508 [Brassica rapa subsp. trilocularis]|uniref:Uncharacterized protein n=1 Tax=Brassica rapa subsp. trilocularis TaxID=1813537 RepID=A0ABQ7LN46_BRACM|nr:hypothetical protein IGI04_029508 [Brassica rapa subsp. trilocularis]